MKYLDQKNKSDYLEVSVFDSSTWIANLGVVPLFTFAIFLFFPAFFILLILLRFNILVLETINFLPSINNHFLTFVRRIKYLPTFNFIVKAFIIIISVGWIENMPSLMANANTTTYESIILAKGEHKELASHNLKKFSVTNQEVISYKHLPKKEVILIKGKMLGFSEVVFWNKSNTKFVYRIYVLNKSGQNKILHLAQNLKAAGLQISMNGITITAAGELNNYFSYDLVWKLLKNNPKKIHTRISLSKKLKNKIIGEVYYYLLGEYKDEVVCENMNHEIICRYAKDNPPSKSIINLLKQKFHIKLIPSGLLSGAINYKLKIKLIQIEYQNESNISFGLDQLNGNLGDFFNANARGIIEQNQIILKENNLSLSTLAEPELILTLNKPATIQVGSEIPFSNNTNPNNNISHTDWKFAGLKITLTLKKDGPYYKIEYNNEFTRPGVAGVISGSKEISNALIRPNQPLELFQIGFKAFGKGTGQLPILGNIPILGKLFQSNTNKSTYKKITAIMVLSKNEI